MKSNLWDDINEAYTAQLIMTSLSSVVCWEIGSSQDAIINPDGSLKYDVIPVNSQGNLIGFMTKEKPFETQSIEKGWIITQDTPISDLANLFGETNHMERWYNRLRQSNARFVRRTLSFSKSDKMHEVVTKLFIFRYNLSLST